MTEQVPGAHARDKTYYQTRSLCPECLALVPGRVLSRDGRVYVGRTCAAHGDFEGLVCSDVAWYERLPLFDVEGIAPKMSRTQTVRGCPEDCGLCPQHQQIAGAIALEISNHCDASCPTCFADNLGTFELSPDEVSQAITTALGSQDHIDSVTLSGGEPTLHPQLFEIIDVLQRPEVCRVSLNSNGRRIAVDDALLDRLARYDNVHVCLHFDGPGAKPLRGAEPELQELALERLCKWGISSVPVILAAKGVNDHALGPLVERLLTRSPHVKSVHVSLLAHSGPRGSAFPGDPMTRLTIPEALDCIAASSQRGLRRRDFMPMPMPNPICTAIGYFLIIDGTITPLIPLHDIERVVELVKNTHVGTANLQFEQFMREIIMRIYASDAPDAPALLARLKKLVELVFPPDSSITQRERVRNAERLIKSVFFLQIMDAWSFDNERLHRCSCQHVMPDGRIIPSCSYNLLHRRADPRFTLAGRPR